MQRRPAVDQFEIDGTRCDALDEYRVETRLLELRGKGAADARIPQPSVNGDLVTIEQRGAPGRKPTNRPAVKPRMLSGPRASTGLIDFSAGSRRQCRALRQLAVKAIIRGFFADLATGQVDPQDPARISVRHVPLLFSPLGLQLYHPVPCLQ